MIKRNINKLIEFNLNQTVHYLKDSTPTRTEIKQIFINIISNSDIRVSYLVMRDTEIIKQKDLHASMAELYDTLRLRS